MVVWGICLISEPQLTPSQLLVYIFSDKECLIEDVGRDYF